MSILFVAGLVTVVLFLALSMDGVISDAPLRKLTNFPFDGLPATNALIFMFFIGSVVFLAHWRLSS